MSDKLKEPESVEQIERELLLEAINRRYGYDFRDYAEPSLIRRIDRVVEREKLGSISALQERVLHDELYMQRFVSSISVHVTSMFRDPQFFSALRTKVTPLLRTYPYLRIWVAGCATGEEVYSLAIMLKEAGLYDRCRIYATDISDEVIERAKEGIFPLSDMQEYTRNYRSFNEFQLILCRNVMIYFNSDLQERVMQLFHASLASLGVLCLGVKESLHPSSFRDKYQEMAVGTRIFKALT